MSTGIPQVYFTIPISRRILTTEAEKQVNDLAGQVKGIDSNILASLSLDTSSVDTLKASVNAITGEQLRTYPKIIFDEQG